MHTRIVTYMYARYNFIYFEIFHDTVALGVDLHVCIDSSNKSFNSTFAIHYKKLSTVELDEYIQVWGSTCRLSSGPLFSLFFDNSPYFPYFGFEILKKP